MKQQGRENNFKIGIRAPKRGLSVWRQVKLRIRVFFYFHFFTEQTKTTSKVFHPLQIKKRVPFDLRTDPAKSSQNVAKGQLPNISIFHTSLFVTKQQNWSTNRALRAHLIMSFENQVKLTQTDSDVFSKMIFCQPCRPSLSSLV